MTSHTLWLALSLVGALVPVAPARAQTPPASTPVPATDSSAPAAASEPIGNVATLTGTATVIRNKNSLSLHLRDDIFLNDQVQTSSSSSLGITFNDATTFNLSASAKMTIDNYIYEDGGKQNAGIFDIGKGTVAFVAAAVAKTGDMKITTPTSTLGIRGTTGLVEVPQSAAAGGAAGSGNGENIKLYPDADGHVGRIEVNDHSGQRIGALTQGASGLTVHPGVGSARPTAQPLAISPQQATRDQGLVRQVHAAQTVGRQVVTEQRAARRANPPGANAPNRGNQPAQPQRQNQAPGQNRQGQQQPNQPAKPGEKPGQNTKQGTQPATPPKPGEKKSETKPGTTPAAQKPGERKPETAPATPPASPQRRGAAPQAPGASPAPQPAVRQGGAPPRPAQQRPRQPSPKEKKKKF
ncbi:FecR domain-containing protein [Bradyrhizobium sp. Tv2a-2]|uniref:FecR domain-containing protein n=1 Tax=Bradyrhizobium sp. Tv2a-2 TaxID=113395 RepID=UPI000466E07D|nr:FecR domain-containing protein [Bradyrhizobium sp. Tv2a-2]